MTQEVVNRVIKITRKRLYSAFNTLYDERDLELSVCRQENEFLEVYTESKDIIKGNVRVNVHTRVWWRRRWLCVSMSRSKSLLSSPVYTPEKEFVGDEIFKINTKMVIRSRRNTKELHMEFQDFCQFRLTETVKINYESPTHKSRPINLNMNREELIYIS